MASVKETVIRESILRCETRLAELEALNSTEYLNELASVYSEFSALLEQYKTAEERISDSCRSSVEQLARREESAKALLDRDLKRDRQAEIEERFSLTAELSQLKTELSRIEQRELRGW